MPILLAKTYTNNVPDSPGRWKVGEIVAAFEDGHLFGAKETPEAGYFYHVMITDKTLAEVRDYLQSWRHNPDVQQVSANGNDRLIEVTSTMVSATGKNAFTQAGVEQLMSDINDRYAWANAAYDSHTNSSFRFTITADVSARDVVIEMVNEAVEDMQFARRRWYINAAGRAYMDANNNQASGTAAQLATYLRDGLLD